jgi:hypothetical protein
MRYSAHNLMQDAQSQEVFVNARATTKIAKQEMQRTQQFPDTIVFMCRLLEEHLRVVI